MKVTPGRSDEAVKEIRRQLLGRSLAYSTTTPQTGSSHRPADHSDDSPDDVEHLRTQGHRLGVVLISTDHDYTLRHPPGTRMTVRTGLSSVTLPVAPPAGS
ncbi:hypothetical protein ACIP4T_20730 [Streptomyces massasporeus]|uniref:hypothetical protein n=1 Tax=Streptomyces massasporeus TaxID=67324 RepID=UPI0036CB3985